MDHTNGSNGSSPLTDGDMQKNDASLRQGDDDDKKGQIGNSRSGMPNQNQAGRKGPMAVAAGGGSSAWRPIPPGVGGVGQVANQMAGAPRMPGKPRMPVGSPNQTMTIPGAPPTGAWPTNTGGGYFPSPRAPARFPNTNQNLSQQAALNQFVGQQASNLMSANGMQGGGGGYGGPRNMMQQAGGMAGMGGGMETLSKTNLYIRGLPTHTTDSALFDLCRQYGNINSTKAIIDKMTNQCKGYGFVDFDNSQSAERALKDLSARGMQVQMAKVRSPQDQMQVIDGNYQGGQEADPTNLYLANLPSFMVEQDLDAMLQQYGRVVSTRILRDLNHQSRGVGFARMESKEVCDKVIELLNGKILTGSTEQLVIKFADSGNRRRNMNRERGGWRMDGSRMGMGAYGQMDGGQNGLAGSMMTSIRYGVPQAAALTGYQNWPPQYTLLPQQMMQGVEGGYSMSQMSQLAAQMSQLGLSPAAYNPSPYSAQYGYSPQQMFPQGMAQMGGGAGQVGDEAQPEAGVPGHSSVGVPASQNMAGAYGNYSQQK